MLDLSESTVYEFDEFRLDTQSRRLFRRGSKKSVSLTPKAIEVLLALVQNRARLLTKDELLDTVWSGSFVEEGNLTQTIFVLRKALGDDRKDPRFILTIPNRGYQFIADVSERHSGDEILEESILSDTAGLEAPPPTSIRRAKSATIVIAAGVLVLAVSLAAWLYPWFAAPGDPVIKSIAILPFEDLSEGQTERYLGVSLADALAKQFGSIKTITVRPIGSVLKYSSARSDHQTIGRELRVDAVLQGRIQRVGDRLRVNAQLVRVSDNATVWVENFDDAFSNFFAVQDSISGRVVTALALRIEAPERQRFDSKGTSDSEAYQAYMRGRYFWNKRSGDGLKKAIIEFEQAVRKDPNYALAYAGLADAHQLTAEYSLATPKDAFPNAREAAQKALSIDPNLAEGHTSIAYTQAFFDWDWPAAEASFQRALAIDPNYPTAHQWYGEYLVAVGRFDTARMHYERALQIDPTSPILMTEIVALLHLERRYDEMIDHAKRTIDLDPNFAYPYYYLGLGYEAQGLNAEAVDAMTRMMTLFGEPVEVAVELRTAYDKDGLEGFWKKRAEQIQTFPHLKYFPEMTKAIVHIHAGDKEATLAALAKSLELREHNFVYVTRVPDLDAVREDPRYGRMIQQLGL